MGFQYTPQLREHMKRKGRTTVLVELVEIAHTDLDVTEFNVRLADEKTKEHFLTKKRYRRLETAEGDVLLPPFPLELADTVTFGLKSFLGFKYLTCQGIKV